MKVIKKTFVTVAAFFFLSALALFLATLGFAACSEKVTLRFETFDGTPLDSVEGVIGGGYASPGEPKKEGYFFDGWYLTEDCAGERQTLPERMPSESVTYYAKFVKYPVLTLETAGGTLAKTEHLVRPGTRLSVYLSAYKPVKPGLVFGGWTAGESLLSGDAEMTETDLTLTAVYKARYAVDVYLQDADDPALFTRSEELSFAGEDWENAVLAPEIGAPEHFLADDVRTPVKTRILRAGDNTLSFYFTRQEVDLTFHPCSPDGTGQSFSVHTRYGAHIRPEAASAEGYEFFGWADREGGPALLAAGAEVTAGAEDGTFYGAWAKVYRCARGEGTLSVAEYAENGRSRAVYRAPGVVKEGEFDVEKGVFSAEEIRGRVDRYGGVLLDDSGRYGGYGLLENGVSVEKYGELVLDFDGETATYLLGGKRTEGEYRYLYDEEREEYTGKYLFCEKAEGGESFLFLLREGHFLREGAEKGEYTLYDCMSGEFDRSATLSLDGFGGAVFRAGGGQEGSYCGYSADGGEWNFAAEEGFRFLLGGKIWDDGVEERAFLRYDGQRAGNYRGADGSRLLLDGYGYVARLSGGQETAEGPFVLQDGFVSLYAEGKTLRFTLKGDEFFPTGPEAGGYAGERGELFLDGAGGARLQTGGANALSGSYAQLEGGDYTCSFPGGGFRFCLTEGGYSVFSRERYGTFDWIHGARLTLDGYGGGTYVGLDGEPIPVSLGYCDEETFEVLSPRLLGPLLFHVTEDRTIELVQRAEAGRYFLLSDGDPVGDYLFLDGAGGAKLSQNGTVKRGGYVYSARTGEADVLFSGETLRFLLTERDGAPCCIRQEGAGSYSGPDKTLSLDGYGGAVYTAEEEIACSYRLVEGGAELSVGDRIIKLALREGEILSAAEFDVFEGEEGILLLERGGSAAMLRSGAEETAGEYTAGKRIGFFGRTYELRGNKFYRYDGNAAGEYRTAAGEILASDGCGFATLTSGALRAEGTVEQIGGLWVFASEQLATVSKLRAFELQGGVLLARGEEYGVYRGEDGSVLSLDGNGSASLARNGAVQSGEYRSLGNGEYEIDFAGSFRFLLGRTEAGCSFVRYRESLAALEGGYAGEEGVLSVSGYGAAIDGVLYDCVYADGSRLVLRKEGEDRLFTLFQGGYTCKTVRAAFVIR